MIIGMTEEPPIRIPRASMAWGAAFAVLAVLVQATDFDRLNGFAQRHLEPIAPGAGHPRLNGLAEALVAPGAPVTASVLVVLGSWLLWRRSHRAAVVRWPLSLAGAFLVEVVCKVIIDQHRSGVWSGFGLAFDSSFPSGHMMRVILLAALGATLWPMLRVALTAWCLVVALCMLVTGFHLPTDIAGGILAGLALATAASAEPIKTSSWGRDPSSASVNGAADRRSTGETR